MIIILHYRKCKPMYTLTFTHMPRVHSTPPIYTQDTVESTINENVHATPPATHNNLQCIKMSKTKMTY